MVAFLTVVPWITSFSNTTPNFREWRRHPKQVRRNEFASIKHAVSATRELIPSYVKLPILGHGKIDQIHEFKDLGIASIDTTSPMLRAFKDNRRNFLMPGPDGMLNYNTSIRIPQATENRGLSALMKKGHFSQTYLLAQEKEALAAMRALDKGKCTVDEALGSVMAYTNSILVDPKTGDPASAEKKLSGSSQAE